MTAGVYQKAQYEEIPCALCSNKYNFDEIALKDRDDLDARTVLCRNCGLMFISPRMTKKWYDLYYKEEYRQSLKRRKNRLEDIGLEKYFKSGKEFGVALGTRLADYINSGLTIDMGSGVGGVLAGLKEVKPGIEPVGIEPSQKEAEYANSQGVKTYVSLFENFNQDLALAANIFSIRNLNHLLEPREFLEWSYKNLKKGGKLILVVEDFILSCKKRGKVLPQIDHVYMFTPETLISFVKSIGFDIIFFDNPERKSYLQLEREKRLYGLTSHMRLVAVKPDYDSSDSGINQDYVKNYQRVKSSLKKWKLFLSNWWYRFYLKIKK